MTQMMIASNCFWETAQIELPILGRAPQPIPEEHKEHSGIVSIQLRP